MALIDVTQPFYVGMSVPPGMPQPQFRTVSRVGVDRANVTEFTLRSHMGTHMDAPYHYVPTGEFLDRVPIERFSGKGFVIPAHLPRLQALHRKDIAQFADRIQGLPFVLFSFDWARHFGTEEYWSHPYIAEDAADELVKLGVGCVAMDTFTPDAPIPLRDEHHTGPTHLVLLGHAVLIVENLSSLAAVEGQFVKVYAFPIKFRDSDGAPVRVVVETGLY